MYYLRRSLPLLVIVAVATFSVPAGSAPPRLVFSPSSVSGVVLGEGVSKAVARFDHLLGPASSALAATPNLANCGVSAVASWRGLRLYVDHSRVVGLSLGPGRTPLGRTARGLRIGDTLARARTLYGATLSTSGNQGGAWYVSSGRQRLRGFLVPSGPAPRATSRIQTLDVGDVGCPAMSP